MYMMHTFTPGYLKKKKAAAKKSINDWLNKNGRVNIRQADGTIISVGSKGIDQNTGMLLPIVGKMIKADPLHFAAELRHDYDTYVYAPKKRKAIYPAYERIAA